MNTGKIIDFFMRFPGYGNPKSNIWFIGIEEGGAPFTLDNISNKIKEYSKYPYYIEPNDVKDIKTQVWDYISKFVVKYKENIDYADWHSYREIMFSESESAIFLTWLYPLPKARFKNWPLDYKKLFGYSANDRKKYFETVREKRFPIIRKLWDKMNPELTICFGKSCWEDHKIMLNLDCKNFYENSEIDNSKNIVLIPFLGNGRVSNIFIENLAKELKSV